MKESKTKVDNSFGPSSFERDEHGLLKNVQYDFNEDGSINWSAFKKFVSYLAKNEYQYIKYEYINISVD